MNAFAKNVKYTIRELDIWKRLLMVSHDTVWCTIIIALSCFTVMESLYRSINGACVNRDAKLFIITDIIYSLDIILYLGSLSIPRINIPEINLATRPKWIIVCEIISLVPINHLIPTETQKEREIYCVFRLNRALKIVRIFSFNSTTEKYLIRPAVIVVVQLIFYMFFVTTLTQAFYYNCRLILYKYRMGPYSAAALLQNITISLITGGKTVAVGDVTWELSVMLGIIVSLYLVNTRISYFVVTAVNQNTQKSIYRQKYLTAEKKFVRYNTPDWLVMCVNKMFNEFWRKRGGYEVGIDCLKKILPPSIENAVKLNMSYTAFQHSKMFRNMNWSFLRHMSNAVDIQYYFPGEYVFRVNDYKNKMLYLVTGTIQILSDEDGVSPIFSFTAGTCLGESTLFVSYKSTTVVQCQTYCVFYILRMENFQRQLSVFDKERNYLRGMIRKRYIYARELRNLWYGNQSEENQRKNRCVSTVWLKNTLHRLMSVDKDSILRHEFQNIYLINEYNQKHYESKIFTALHLDTLVIEERLPPEKESLFLKKTFPVLIQPYSANSYIWEAFVIAVAIIMLIAVPYTAFIATEVPLWYTFLKNFATVVFWMDVVVVLSTSMSGPNGLNLSFKDNVSARFRTPSFWFTVLAAFPLEIFTPLLVNELNNKTTVALHLNRSCKILRLVRHINSWRENYTTNITVSWLLILLLTRFYWTYAIYTCINFFTNDGGGQLQFFIDAILYTTSMSGVEVPDYWIFIMSQYVVLGLWIWITAGLCSSIILSDKNVQDVQELAFQLLQLLKQEKLEATSRRLQNYLVTQYLDNGSFYFHYDREGSIYVSNDAKAEVVSTLLMEDLEKAKCFAVFNDVVLLAISAIADLRLYPANEIITQAGDIADSIYILHKGSCDIINHNDEIVKSLDTIIEINLLEALFDVPCIYTTTCRTHCKVIKITRMQFMSVMLKHWDQWSELNLAIATSLDIKKQLLEMSKTAATSGRVVLTSYFERSFNVFRNTHLVGRYEEYDYYSPFDKLYLLGFMRYFLMKLTFNPEGRFLYVWECARIFFATISCLASFCVPILKSNQQFWLLLLDLTAMADIYVRCHVAYYDGDGLLITHPLSTATHYLSHGFLADLIGVLPFRYFYEFSVVSEVLFNGTRLFQLHRYIQFLNLRRKYLLKPISRLNTIMFMPLVLVLTNLFACTLFMLECYPTQYENHLQPNNVTFTGFRCIETTLLSSAAYKYNISMLEAHWFLLWVFTSVLTEQPQGGYQLKSEESYSLLAFGKVLALFINVLIFCRIYTYFSFRDTALIETQISLNHLKRWLLETIPTAKLRKAMMATQVLRWNRYSNIWLPTFIRPFNPVLRTDALQESLGRFLWYKNPFKTEHKRFYRSILKHISVDVVIKGGYLQTINDIDDNIYILVDGMADVVAADGTRIATLGMGSMFGNLTSSNMARLKVSVIAMTNTEVLCIKTDIWNRKIAFYPDLELEYMMLRNSCTYYILVKPSIDFLLKIQKLEDVHNQVNPILMGTSTPSTRLSRNVKKFYLFLPCYFGVMTDLYQLTVFDFATPVLVFQILCDIIFCVQVIMQDRMAFEDRLGFKIRDLNMLRARNRSNTFFTWIRFICLCPLDIILYNIPRSNYLAGVLYCTFRSPKLLRIFFFNDFLLTKRTGMLANLFWYRIVHIFAWLLAILQCSVYVMSFMCYMEKNMNVHVPRCKVFFYSSTKDKFSLYVRYMFILVNAYARKAQTLYYPVAANTYIMFTIMMLAMHSLFCILSARTFSTFYEWFVVNCKYYHLYEHLNRFLDNEKISFTIRTQALTYVKTMWFMWQGEYFPTLVSNATPYLKDALYNSAYSYLVRKHKIFQKCHPDFVRQLVQKFEVRAYFAGQFIQFAGSNDHRMYFVYSGQVTVENEEDFGEEAVVLWLKKGACFGVFSGLHKYVPHKYSYRCVVRSTILSLCLDDWEYLLNYFPATKELIYSAAKTYVSVC